MYLRLTYCTIGLLALALFITALLCEHPAPNVKPERSGLTEQADKEAEASSGQGISRTTPHGPTIKTGDGQKPTEQKRETHSKAIEYWWWLACLLATISGQTYFIFFTAVFTGLLALFTFQLVRVTKDVAVATKNTTTTMIAIERPWLISVKPQINGWPLRAKLWPLWRFGVGYTINLGMSYTINNVGHSPAFITSLSVKGVVIKIPLPEPLYGKSQFPDFVIPPGGAHGGESKVPNIPYETVQEIRTGRKVILLYGRLIYESRLGEKREHITCFCNIWGYRNGRPYFDPVGVARYITYT